MKSRGTGFVDELMGLLSGDARDRAADLCRRWTGNVYIAVPDRREAIERRVLCAIRQLNGGGSTADAARVVMARFRCSKRTAEGAVRMALLRSESKNSCAVSEHHSGGVGDHP